MFRAILILPLLLVLLFGCQKNNIVQTSTDNPEWLKAKISAMSTNHYYYGSKIYRYKWKGAYVYHIEIPISSCIYCELYDQNGASLQFASDSQLQDFVTNKTDKVLIWEWTRSL